jgi:hypothetical protein
MAFLISAAKNNRRETEEYNLLYINLEPLDQTSLLTFSPGSEVTGQPAHVALMTPTVTTPPWLLLKALL